MIKLYSKQSLAILCLYLFSLSLYAQSGRLVFMKGNVSFRLQGSKNYKKMKKGAVVKTGDVIKTGSDGLAIIKNDLMTIKLTKNSLLKLNFRSNGRVSARVTRGGAIFKVMKNKLSKKDDLYRLKVRTKSASVGVRGTTFMVYNGEQKNSMTMVKEGIVDFQGYGSNFAVAVNSDKTAMTNQEKKNLKPRNLGLAQKVNWELDTKKQLRQSDEFYAHAEKLWQAYKKEQEIQWKNYKKEQQDLWNNYINN